MIIAALFKEPEFGTTEVSNKRRVVEESVVYILKDLLKIKDSLMKALHIQIWMVRK